MNDTVWEFLKPRWKITKKRLKELSINPSKEWGELTYNELCSIADELDITVSELTEW